MTHKRKFSIFTSSKSEFISIIVMTQVDEVYLCEICGNKVKVLEAGGGELTCCGEAMSKVE